MASSRSRTPSPASPSPIRLSPTVTMAKLSRSRSPNRVAHATACSETASGVGRIPGEVALQAFQRQQIPLLHAARTLGIEQTPAPAPSSRRCGPTPRSAPGRAQPEHAPHRPRHIAAAQPRMVGPRPHLVALGILADHVRGKREPLKVVRTERIQPVGLDRSRTHPPMRAALQPRRRSWGLRLHARCQSARCAGSIVAAQPSPQHRGSMRPRRRGGNPDGSRDEVTCATGRGRRP